LTLDLELKLYGRIYFFPHEIAPEPSLKS